MKKRIGIFIIFGCLLLSCDRNPNEYPVTVEITNKSGKAIKIFDFDRFSSNPLTVFELSDQDTIVQRFIETEGESLIGPRDFFEGDSLKIIFGDAERFLIYTCKASTNLPECNKPGNPLNISDPSWNLGVDNNTRRIYTFTPSDFDNAEPCNGNCD